MYWMFLFSALIVAYVSGSVNFAIIISTFLGKGDIRTMGNLKPGTANIGRNLGRGWGTVVFFGDVAKVVVPLIIAEEVYFNIETYEGTAALMLIAMAAILGHRKPLFFGFKGGGGLATTIGAFAFFGLIELSIAMLVGAGAGMLLFGKREYRFGRWVAMLIILLTPVTHLVCALIIERPLAGALHFGGRNWPLIAAVAILSMYVFLSNMGTILQTINSQRVKDSSASPVDHSQDT